MRATVAAAAESVGDLSRVRRPIEHAWHAPGTIYHSPELYRLEIERYFRTDWLFVGRVEELSQPGDFLTMRIAGEPIVVAHDKDGNLNAFYNMCVHRGVEVAYGCGNAKSFKCPYHGWVYDLAGNLTGAAYMKESPGFEIGAERMRPLRLGVWRKNIFVTFNDQAPPLETFIAEWEKDFGFLGWERCRLGNKIELEFACNWKFVHENLMDFYHVGVLHAKTFGSKFSWTDNGILLKEGGGLSIFYNAAPPTPGGEPLLGKMPWMEDRPHSFACTGYLPPNLTMFGRIDCVRPMVTWPLSEGRSRTVIYHLFPEEFFARPDFEEKLKIYREYQILVLEEDRTMIESMQQAMGSPTYKPGRMSVLEKPLHHFLNGHLDRLFGRNDRQEAAE
ncbi:MAG: aromatic ring-hydroxylating dioxygenase subunit alpha [Alphaproteobacteria bacterium]|nr:aromatic ring-hydroxylating dioxygenase subunit alpha [Alphaproteobacteria bacterium]